MLDNRENDDRLAESIAGRNKSADAMDTARAACEELYSRHAPGLLVYLASRVLTNDLEDIHQAIWQRVWNALPASYRGGNLRAWIFSNRQKLFD